MQNFIVSRYKKIGITHEIYEAKRLWAMSRPTMG